MTKNWVIKNFELEIQKGRPNNWAILQYWLPQEIRSLIFNFWKFETFEKSTPESCRMHWNLMNDEEFGSLKLLKLKYRRGDQIIQLFCRIGSPQEIIFPLFNSQKLQSSEKGTPESCKMHWNLMNDKEFRSFKLLKLKYRRGDRIIQLFCRICYSQEIRSLLFNL